MVLKLGRFGQQLWIALCGGIVLEEALDLSLDRILNNNKSRSSSLSSLLHSPFNSSLLGPTIIPST